MSELSFASSKYELVLFDRQRTCYHNTFPLEKSVEMLVDLRIFNYLITNIRTSNGEILKVGDQELVTLPLRVQFPILPQILSDVAICRHYVMTKLADFNVDRFTSDYLAHHILCYAYSLEAWVANVMGYGVHVFEIEGELVVTKNQVMDEKIVLGGLKKEVFEDWDDKELSCAICLEELSGESECTRTPCSHFFHHGCIVPWLVKHKSCPICRRIVRD